MRAINPKQIGEQTEAVLMAKLLLRGETVLRPFGDNQRYDMVLDKGGIFVRIQCKTGRLKKGCITFATYSKAGGGPRKGYDGEVEFFGVYCPENGKSYLIPIEDCAKNGSSLRIEKITSYNGKKIRWAAQYEI